MKKNIVMNAIVIAVLAMIFILFEVIAAEHANATDASSDVSIQTTTVSAVQIATPAAISLEEAYEQLKGSDTWALIELSNLSDKGIANGYKESISSLEETKEAASNAAFLVSYDSSNLKQTKARRAYAKSMLEANQTARENALNLEVFTQYYTLKNTEANLEIATTNLAAKKEALRIAEKKYQLGTVSKLDVLTAEIDYQEAQNTYTSAQNSLASTQMDFNIYMGFELMQEVTLTDELEAAPLPSITLEEAIPLAIENRIDIKAAAYALEMAQYGFNTYVGYPTNSSKYISAKVALVKAQIINAQASPKVEMDVREQYADMLEKYSSVQLGMQSVAKAQESVVIAQKRYEVGLITLSTLQQAQSSLYSAQLSQAQNLVSYNLAVEAFTYSYGVGTTVASI